MSRSTAPPRARTRSIAPMSSVTSADPGVEGAGPASSSRLSSSIVFASATVARRPPRPGAARARAPRRPRRTGAQLESGGEGRERCPELVTGIGHHAAFPLGVLALAVDERVEGPCERGELVVRGPDGQVPGRGAGAQLLGRPTHPADRPERQGREQPGGRGEGEEREDGPDGEGAVDAFPRSRARRGRRGAAQTTEVPASLRTGIPTTVTDRCPVCRRSVTSVVRRCRVGSDRRTSAAASRPPIDPTCPGSPPSRPRRVGPGARGVVPQVGDERVRRRRRRGTRRSPASPARSGRAAPPRRRTARPRRPAGCRARDAGPDREATEGPHAVGTTSSAYPTPRTVRITTSASAACSFFRT